MKKILILILIPLAGISQNAPKPIASLYGGVSNYHLQVGAEFGLARLITENYSVVAYTHFNSVGGEALVTAGIKMYAAAWWLDSERESFVAPVAALQNAHYYTDEFGKTKRNTTALFGGRYQVYGGYCELLWQPQYVSFTVGYQFGNRKN
jgi:hypothetical protein